MDCEDMLLARGATACFDDDILVPSREHGQYGVSNEIPCVEFTGETSTPYHPEDPAEHPRPLQKGVPYLG